MIVYLDDERIEPEAPTLWAAIDLARRTAHERGRVIIEVKGDGDPLDADTIDDADGSDVGFAELRLVSTAPGPMAREILLEACDTLDRARLDQSRAAELIQSGAIADALDPMQSALEAWSLVREVVDKIQALTGISPVGVHVSVRGGQFTGGECVASLTAALAQLRAAVRASDWSALSDLLAYDLDEQADRWRAMLAALAESAVLGDSGAASTPGVE
ncbi:MAG: hypothetical protein R3B57_04260 [Phycisphaerales bacterium]